VSIAALWPAGFELPSEAVQAQPRAHSESPAESARLRAEPVESLPACRPRSHSTRWRTPEILCLLRRGRAQTQGSPVATWTTFAARFLLAPRSYRPLHRSQPTVGSTSVAKSPAKTGGNQPSWPNTLRVLPQNPQWNRRFTVLYSPFVRLAKSRSSALPSRKSASFCYTWVIPVHFPLTTKCA
jgi:hypothetical protein